MAEGAPKTEMEKMFAKFLENQSQNAPQQRLKSIDKITKKEDFPTWRGKLMKSLRRHDLDKYIKTNVPEPADPDLREKWKTERADVEDYILTHVPSN